MMVWSLFIIGLMGLFFYNKIDSIIPMVVLPTTEIIEPELPISAPLSFFIILINRIFILKKKPPVEVVSFLSYSASVTN